MRLLFLCAGNVGRSPLADGLARLRLAEALGVPMSDLAAAGVEVMSAGLRAPSGIAVSPHSVASAARLGVDISAHRSHHCTAGDAEAADRIFCMDQLNLADIHALSPSLAAKTTLLDPDGGEIPDPRFEDRAFHERVCEEIDRCVLARLPEWLGALASGES